MKTSRKRWITLVSVVASLMVTLWMMPVASAATTCPAGTSIPCNAAQLNGIACNTPSGVRAACANTADAANIVKACKAAGCTVSDTKAAAIVKACKTAKCSTNASNVATAVKACKAAGCKPSAANIAAMLKMCKANGCMPFAMVKACNTTGCSVQGNLAALLKACSTAGCTLSK